MLASAYQLDIKEEIEAVGYIINFLSFTQQRLAGLDGTTEILTVLRQALSVTDLRNVLESPLHFAAYVASFVGTHKGCPSPSIKYFLPFLCTCLHHTKIIIITAPSGAGKTSITKHLLKTFPDKLAFQFLLLPGKRGV